MTSGNRISATQRVTLHTRRAAAKSSSVLAKTRPGCDPAVVNDRSRQRQICSIWQKRRSRTSRSAHRIPWGATSRV